MGGEFKQVYPVLNEDDSVNWINLIFGGWKNFGRLLIILLLIGMVIWQFYLTLEYIKYLKDIPCVKQCLTNIIEQGSQGLFKP